MKRNPKLKEERRRFISTAIDDPRAAATQLRDAARCLEQTSNSSEVISKLSALLFVSESTIFKDLTCPDCKD